MRYGSQNKTGIGVGPSLAVPEIETRECLLNLQLFRISEASVFRKKVPPPAEDVHHRVRGMTSR